MMSTTTIECGCQYIGREDGDEGILVSACDTHLASVLEERYGPTEVPPCRVCGGKLSIQAAGGGKPTVWGCSPLEDDPEQPGHLRLKEGRTGADEHYSNSRWEDMRSGGDTRVLRLIGLYRDLEERVAAAEEGIAKMTEIKLAKISEDDGLRMQIASDVWPIFAQACLAFFMEAGGENYVEMQFRHPEQPERFTLTVQRNEGLTPHEARQLAEAKLATTQAELEQTRAEFARLRASPRN